jgi:hypothetical protein
MEAGQGPNVGCSAKGKKRPRPTGAVVPKEKKRPRPTGAVVPMKKKKSVGGREDKEF